MNKHLRKYLKPHKPVEFGFKNYTWVDFMGSAEEIEFKKLWKDKYPFNYFYNEHLKHAWPRVKKSIDDAFYFVKCHTLPSYRFHMIDIRQPKGSGYDEYRWGFRDTDYRLALACFSLLVEFVEKELCVKKEEDWKGHIFSEEAIAKDELAPVVLVDHNKYIEEVRELYTYFTVGRKADWQRHEDALMNWYRNRTRKGVTKRQERALFEASRKTEDDFFKREEEMLIRLIKVRRFLWT